MEFEGVYPAIITPLDNKNNFKEDEFRKINNHYSLCVFSFELGIKKEYDKQRIREAVRKHRLHKKLGIKKKKPLTNAECQRRWRERHPEKAKKHNDALNRKAKAKRAAQRLANI